MATEVQVEEIFPILSHRWALEIDGINPQAISSITDIVIKRYEATCTIHVRLLENENIEAFIKEWVDKGNARPAVFKWVDRHDKTLREANVSLTPVPQFKISDLDYSLSKIVTLSLDLKVTKR